jgi:hypothetical protein
MLSRPKSLPLKLTIWNWQYIDTLVFFFFFLCFFSIWWYLTRTSFLKWDTSEWMFTKWNGVEIPFLRKSIIKLIFLGKSPITRAGNSCWLVKLCWVDSQINSIWVNSATTYLVKHVKPLNYDTTHITHLINKTYLVKHVKPLNHDTTHITHLINKSYLVDPTRPNQPV